MDHFELSPLLRTGQTPVSYHDWAQAIGGSLWLCMSSDSKMAREMGRSWVETTAEMMLSEEPREEVVIEEKCGQEE